eukprot:UN24416
MPPIKRKVEGRGNGIKTVLVNIVDIAGALRTNPKYPTKYLAIEVGAQSTWMDTRNVGIVNGKHEEKELQEVLQNFIEMFILCPECHFPELQHKAKQKRITVTCMSCGHQNVLDNSHNVMKYIYRIMRDEQKEARKLQGSTTEEVVGDVGFRSKVGVDDAKTYINSWVLDPDLSRTHEERKKTHEFNEKCKANFDKEKKETPLSCLKWVIHKKGSQLVDTVSEFARIKLVYEAQDELKLGKDLVDATLDAESYDSLLKSIEQHQLLLGWYAQDENQATILISYVEEFIVLKEWWSKTSEILEKFYDCGIFDSKFLKEWNKMHNAYKIKDEEDVQKLKEHAKPFIDWIE